MAGGRQVRVDGDRPLDGIEAEEVEKARAHDRLTDIERRFCLHLLRHGNTARAYREACSGAGGVNPSKSGWVIRNKPHVAQFLSDCRNERLDRLKAPASRIEEEIAAIAFQNPGRIMVIQDDGTAYYDLTLADETDLAAVAGMKYTRTQVEGEEGKFAHITATDIKTHDKLAALRMLAQIRKMIGADLNVALDVNVADEIREARKRAGLAIGDE